MSPARSVRRSAAHSASRLARVALAILASAGCSPGNSTPAVAPREEVAPVVARDAVLFAPGTVPDALVERLGGARLVLLGEHHYMQQQEDFLVALLPRLQAAGFRWILQEQFHVVAWTGEEYAMGRSDVLPRDEAAFNRTLLDGLRALNAGLPEAERVHYAGFDMNHDPSAFKVYAGIFQDRFGQVAELAPVLATTPGSPEYAAALAALPDALAANEAALSAAIGADRYAQLQDLVAGEQWSLTLRASANHLPDRELFLRDRILKAVSAAGGAGVAVNCGAFHAQQTYLLDQWEPVGAWLAAHPEAYGGDRAALHTLAFLPARGQVLDECCSVDLAYPYDVVQLAPRNDLIRITAEHAGALDAWVPFDDPLFSDRLVNVWAGGGSLPVRPASLYDGMVVYAQVTVLESLSLMSGP